MIRYLRFAWLLLTQRLAHPTGRGLHFAAPQYTVLDRLQSRLWYTLAWLALSVALIYDRLLKAPRTAVRFYNASVRYACYSATHSFKADP